MITFQPEENLIILGEILGIPPSEIKNYFMKPNYHYWKVQTFSGDWYEVNSLQIAQKLVEMGYQ